MRRNIAIYYIISSATNFWFISSNWIYFWTKFMSFGYLGWVDALAFAFSLFLEVPSGAIADIFGKKKTLIFAFVCGAIGTFLIASATNANTLTLGWFIGQFAYSFYSGSAEAMAYDSITEPNVEKVWEKVITNVSNIESITIFIANLVGGFLYAYWFRLPQYLWFSGFIIALFASFFIIEPKKDSHKFNLTKYVNQIKTGTNNLFIKEIRIYTLFILVLVGSYYLYSFGFIRPAMATSFGFYEKEQSIIFSILSISGILLVKLIPYLRKKLKDTTGLIALTFLMGLGFFIASFNIGVYGIIPLIFIAIAGKLSNPWISIVVNKHIKSENRATTLSAVTFITKLPYIFLAVLAGNLIDKGLFSFFTLGIALTIFAVLIVGGIVNNLKKTKVKVI